MALAVRIKPRALRQIEQAAEWWAANRPAAPGAVRIDLESALALLSEQPGIGTRVQLARADIVRRLYLGRIRYFVYYRVRATSLEVISFWHASRGQAPLV